MSMDKLKSHSGTKKRFFPTASGLVRPAPFLLATDYTADEYSGNE
jgi:hypothetical protein